MVETVYSISGVNSGCVSVDKSIGCPVACKNGGTCVEEEAKCLCPPSFTGMECEHSKQIVCPMVVLEW